MATLKEIDGYIKKAQPFAQPILTHFRKLVHSTCPEAEEKIKWGFPHFDYKGQMMCSMASFKQHCAINFWKAALIDEKLVAKAKTEEAMGHLGKITALKDLPSDTVLKKYIKKAMQLNDAGVIVQRTKPVTKNTLPDTPEILKKALAKDAKAKKVWDAATPGFKREYILWVNDAKTDATKEKRVQTTIEWVRDGKKRNWKYER